MQITGLNQLLMKYKSEIEDLETQIKKKKESLNIVYEALKLLQQEGSVQSTLPSLSIKAESISISEKYKGLGINKAIIAVLSNSKDNRYLSTQEIYDEMIKNGFKSASSDIKRDVYIAMYRLEKSRKVNTIKKGNRKKYMIKQTEDSRIEITEPILPQ
jgi:Fe2+ or Zn2+ uptake regulation protein